MNSENLRFDGDYFENADEHSVPNVTFSLTYAADCPMV